ncbi:MAG: hypothetical protein E7569_02260 [Ruminococcaceae bacterium]|nr:hypothetical protein [Oscillospiraceae bacterium]
MKYYLQVSFPFAALAVYCAITSDYASAALVVGFLTMFLLNEHLDIRMCGHLRIIGQSDKSESKVISLVFGCAAT